MIFNRNIFLVLLPIIALSFLATSMTAQLKGTIKNEAGQPLPYATVYIESTSTGTISNVDGEYFLEITQPGEYDIAYQYVGYNKATFKVNYEGTPIHKNIILSDDTNTLTELVILANREDPAYTIIRNAISKREYYKNLVKSYEADLYVKGVVKILDAPKQVLGENVGNLNGILDSMRQGIVYLSESKSKFYFQSPNKTKEIMISTVKSGDNSLFTANQFTNASFDLYNEYLQFGRTIASPIADNALSHYDYKLEGATIDKDGLTVNKIKIIPKSSTSPLLNGYIYITDDYWNIYSTDLKLHGSILKNTFLDTIEVKQVYIPISKHENRKLFSQIFSFKAGIFGFKMGGNFSYIFSNYAIDKDVSQHFQTKETFKVDALALKTDSAFWNAARPIPLTKEEQYDYVKKDSLQRIWSTKTYMDSIDRVNNRLTILNILKGYSIDRSFKKTSLSFSSPLSIFQFNAVEGSKLNLKATWTKDDTLFRKWTIQPRIEYGFADKILKPRLFMEYLFDNYTLGKVYINAGRQYSQFEPRKPISETNNTWYSLLIKKNAIRLYDHTYITVGYAQEIRNGLYLDVNASYTARAPLAVNTHYSFRKKELLYEENIVRPDLSPTAFETNKYWTNKVKLTYRPAQKYSSYPNYKVRSLSDWPTITGEYENGMPLSTNASQFNKLTIRINDNYVNARILGYFNYQLEFGKNFGTAPTFFGDYFHHLSNVVTSPINPEMSSFNLMPYYEFSNATSYIKVNFRHHFNGFITDKIPLINKTPLKLVVGVSGLYQHENGQYLEPFIGIENFKIGPFHLFDIDYSFAFDKFGYRDQGITFRILQFLDNMK